MPLYGCESGVVLANADKLEALRLKKKKKHAKRSSVEFMNTVGFPTDL